MRLAGQRARGRGFVHAFGKFELPLPIPAALLDSMVTRLREGDLTVCNTVAEGHMRLAMSIVGRYLARYNCVRQVEDLVSVAMLAIVQTCKRAVTNLTDNNITPYIVASMHSAISNYMTEDCVIYQPHSASGERARVTDELPEVADSGDVTSGIMLQDLLSKSCVNSIDRKIVELRSKGFGDADVAQAVGLSRAAITKMRHAIELRFIQKEHYRE